ncbi:MAG TPA: SatD family protein [Gemmatimonadales bacterium]
MTTSYVAVIADVTASRTLLPARRARLQAELRRALPELNRRYAPWLAAPFGITLGDELQVLLRDGAGLWLLAHDLRARVPAVEWVVAAGRGPLSTPVRKGLTAPELDGPCFHLARRTLERAKAERLILACAGFPPALDPLLHFYAALYWSWTSRQRTVATAWRRTEALRAAALPDHRPGAAPRESSAASHLRRRMGWALVKAGDRAIRDTLEAS